MPNPGGNVASELCSPNRSIHLCLLLLLRDEPAHGYGLVLQLESLGITSHNRGRIYRSLRWLEDAGLVTCHWDTPPTGPARRMYELSPSGASTLGLALPRLAQGAPPFDDLVSRLVLTLAASPRAANHAS